MQSLIHKPEAEKIATFVGLKGFKPECKSEKGFASNQIRNSGPGELRIDPHMWRLDGLLALFFSWTRCTWEIVEAGHAVRAPGKFGARIQKIVNLLSPTKKFWLGKPTENSTFGCSLWLLWKENSAGIRKMQKILWWKHHKRYPVQSIAQLKVSANYAPVISKITDLQMHDIMWVK